MSDAAITQLYTENLVPIYLLEEKLRTNFAYIQKRMDATDSTAGKRHSEQQLQNARLNEQLTTINDTLSTLQPLVQKRVETRIMQTLGTLIASKISEYYESNSSNEASIIKEIDDKVARRLHQLKADLKVEMTRDAEAMLSNQLTDFRRQINQKLSAVNVAAPAAVGDSSFPFEKAKDILIRLEEHSDSLADCQKKLQKVSDLSLVLERQLYDNHSEVNERLKMVMDVIEDYKSCNNKNIENFKVDFFKLKNSRMALEGAKMDKLDEVFKNNMTATLDQITQTMSGMLTKTEFQQLFYKGLSKGLDDQREEVATIRRELVRLNEVMAYTNQLSQGLEGFEAQLNIRFDEVKKTEQSIRQKMMEEVRDLNTALSKLRDSCTALDAEDRALAKKLEQHRTELLKLPLLYDEQKQAKARIVDLERICSYEDHMDDIHDVLDQQFVVQGDNPNPPQIKRRNNGVDLQRFRQLENEFLKFSEKAKVDIEEVRLLQAKKNELHDIWKAINILETRIEMMKGDEEAVSAAKKQWTCLSCERNIDPYAGKGQGKYKNWDSVIPKKLEIVKSGGFGQKQLSSKNIKPVIPEEKPETIGRVREKYFSDTVKLPDILQDRLHEASREFKLQ